MPELKEAVTIHVPAHLMQYRQDTIDRLSYLFASVTFEQSSAGIVCSSSEPIDRTLLQREIRYALVRSKVRVEGLDQRNALFAAVFR